MAYSCTHPSTTNTFESTRCVTARNGWIVKITKPADNIENRTATNHPLRDNPHRCFCENTPRHLRSGTPEDDFTFFAVETETTGKSFRFLNFSGTIRNAQQFRHLAV